MASTAAPYGLKPVKRVDGMAYAGATDELLINPAGYADNIFNGQIVALNAAGYIELVSEVGSDGDAFPAGTIGVFVGCEYVNTEGQVIFSQYYPAATTGVVKAKVVTDPRVVFQAQADGSVTQASLGANVYLAESQIDGSGDSVGNTRTGNSTIALDQSTIAATSGFAFRIVGFASEVGDAATDLYVIFNPGSHSYTNATGI